MDGVETSDFGASPSVTCKLGLRYVVPFKWVSLYTVGAEDWDQFIFQSNLSRTNPARTCRRFWDVEVVLFEAGYGSTLRVN